MRVSFSVRCPRYYTPVLLNFDPIHHISFPLVFFFFFIHFHKLTRRKDNKLRNFKYRTSNLMPSIYSCGREKKNIFQPLFLLFFFFSPLFYAGLEIGRRDNESGGGFSDIDFS